MQAEIARITRLVDDLLLLAQAEQTEFLRAEPIDARAFVTRAVGRRRRCSADSPLRAGAGARRHAARRSRPPRAGAAQPDAQRDRPHRTGAGLVRMQRAPRGRPSRVRFVVQDDGPGIPPQQRERGVRALPSHRRRARSRLGRHGPGARDRARDRARLTAGASRRGARPRAARASSSSCRVSLRTFPKIVSRADNVRGLTDKL